VKFRYEYRTKDNEIHRGEIAAVDRDAAFAALKAQGIKASRMEEAPGFFNKLFGKGKRWIGIAVLGVGCLVLWLVLENTKEELVDATRMDEAVPRHQIYGDPEVVSKFGTYDGLQSVLANEGDALLGCFAQPSKVAETGDRKFKDDVLNAAMTNTLKIVSSDGREVRELKQIVNWIRAEMIAYVNNPNDHRDRKKKLQSYMQRLVQRTAEEKRIYQMIEQELKNTDNESVRSERNAKLRRLGLPPVIVEEK